MLTSSLSAYETFHFVFGLLLAFCQPILLHRAWHRLQFGEFLFLFVVDQFLLLHFFFLPPKAKLPSKKREVIQLNTNNGQVKPMEKKWSSEDFQNLKSALQQMESVGQ